MAFVSTTENLEILSAVCDALRNLEPDETVSKKRLDNLLRGKQHLLAKARTMVEKDDGCVFATVIGVGVKKLPPSKVVQVGERARIRASRGLSKAQGQIVGVVRSSEGIIPAVDKLKLTNELNKLGLAVEFCRD